MVRRLLLVGAKNASLKQSRYKTRTSQQDFGVSSGTCVLLGDSQHDPQDPAGLKPVSHDGCAGPAGSQHLDCWQLSPVFDPRQLKGLVCSQKAEDKASGLLKYDQTERLLGGPSPGNRFKSVE